MFQSKLILAAGIIGGLIAVWWYGYSVGKDHEKARATENLNAALLERERFYARDLTKRESQDQSDREASRIAAESLTARIRELESLPPTVLVKTKVVKDASGQECPAVPDGLSDQFWLRYFEAGGDPGPGVAPATRAVF